MSGKDKERKKLFESQRQLLILKNQLVQNALNEYQQAVNLIATELGIDIEKEVWNIDESFKYISFVKKKKPDLIIPSRKGE